MSVVFTRPRKSADGGTHIYASVPGEETDLDARKVLLERAPGTVTWRVQVDTRHKLHFRSLPLGQRLSLDDAQDMARRWLQNAPFPPGKTNPRGKRSNPAGWEPDSFQPAAPAGYRWQSKHPGRRSEYRLVTDAFKPTGWSFSMASWDPGTPAVVRGPSSTSATLSGVAEAKHFVHAQLGKSAKAPRSNPRGSSARRNPQRAFNPINYFFYWTKDWYEWNRTDAIRAARAERDALAKRLQAQGYQPRKWSLSNQRVRRGGIGSGHPEIDEVVTVFMLDY